MTLRHALSPEWITFGVNDFVLTGNWRGLPAVEGDKRAGT